MKVECNCGTEMELATYEPEDSEIQIGFECPKCNATLYGTFTEGEKESEDN